MYEYLVVKQKEIREIKEGKGYGSSFFFRVGDFYSA